MYFKHFPPILKPLKADLIFDLPNDHNAIYLTFDDGPTPEITPWVLDQLDEFNAKATFFLVGQQVEKHPDLVQLIRDRGHSIGMHGYAHLSGWKTPNTEYIEDISRCHELLQVSLLRPPYGKLTRRQSKYLKKDYDLIMWSDLSADFDQRYSSAECVEFATKKAKAGSIIVFHDSEKAWPRLSKALPECLKFYSSKGFKMEAIKLENSRMPT